jgi:hypothetical protein
MQVNISVVILAQREPKTSAANPALKVQNQKLDLRYAKMTTPYLSGI